MTVDKKIRVSELQHVFKLKKAKLEHVDLQIETLEAERNLIGLELTDIKAELIEIEHGVQVITKEGFKQPEQVEKVDEVKTFLDLKNDLDLGLTEINSNSGELTLDFTQSTSIVTDESKDVISSFIESLEHELNEK